MKKVLLVLLFVLLGYNLSQNMMVTASYSTVSVSNDGGNWGSFGVGLMFGL